MAISLPEGLIRALSGVRATLDRHWRGISWVDPVSIHLTLKFIGELPEDKADKAGEMLVEAAKGIKPFTVTVEGIGAFPTLKAPRVVWAGVREEPSLMTLAANIEERLAGAGIEKDERPFHPHLTLCRIKSPSDGRELSRLIEGQKPQIMMDFPVRSFVLFRSELRAGGAVHTPLKTVSLG